MTDEIPRTQSYKEGEFDNKSMFCINRDYDTTGEVCLGPVLRDPLFPPGVGYDGGEVVRGLS